MKMKSDKELIEETLSTAKVFDGTLLHVWKDSVKCPNGNESTREYIKHNGAAAILPITKEGNVVLERQYRYPLKKAVTEIPAGKKDPGETFEETARRELEEETGYKAEKLESLGYFLPSCAYSTEVIGLFLAEGLERGKKHLDFDETIEVFEVPLTEFIAMCKDGRIDDGKTLAAALRYLLLRN